MLVMLSRHKCSSRGMAYGGNSNMKYIATLKNLLNDESGQDLIEYALVAALIALGAITAMKSLANGLGNAFSTISSDLSSAVA
jgi:pilus assembly protein Flp/PilA